MSDEGVLEKAHSAVKMMADKYVKAALKHSGSEVETTQQINLLTKTFKKFVNISFIYSGSFILMCDV